MKKKKTMIKKRRAVKRLLRVFLALFIGLPLLFYILVFLLIDKKQTSRFLSAQLTAATGQTVYFDKVKLYPLGGLDIHNVRIGAPEDTAGIYPPLFEMEKLLVRFRLLPLFVRRLEIYRIHVESPKLHLSPPDSEQYASDKDIKEVPAHDSSAASALPLAMGLEKLVLNNFDFSMEFSGNEALRRLSVNGLFLDISGIHIPRDIADNYSSVKGNLRLFSRQSRFIMENAYGKQVQNLGLDINTSVHENHWALSGDLSLKPEEGMPELSLLFDIAGYGMADSVNCRNISLQFSDYTLLRVKGQALNITDSGLMDFDFSADTWPAFAIVQDMVSWIPEPWKPEMPDFEYDGRVNLLRGSARGPIDDLTVHFETRLDSARLYMPEARIAGNGISFFCRAGGILKNGKLSSGQMTSELLSDSIVIALSDTALLHVHPVSVFMEIFPDSMFMPAAGNVTANIGHILSGSVNLKTEWTAPDMDTRGLNAVRVNGNLAAENLLLNALPIPDNTLNGRVDISLPFNGAGLRGWKALLEIKSSPVNYILNEIQETAPPLLLMADIHAENDSLFNQLDVLSFSLKFQDILSAFCSGRFSSQSGNFSVSMDSLFINNSALAALLPIQMKEDMEGLTFGGRELLSGNIEGRILPDTVLIFTEGRLAFQNIRVDMPAQNMNIDKTNGLFLWKGGLEALEGQISFSSDMLNMPDLREDAYSFDIAGTWSIKSLDTLKSALHITSADLGLKMNSEAKLSGLQSKPEFYAQADMHYFTDTHTEIMDKFFSKGDMRISLRVHSDYTENGLPYWFAGGNLLIDSLSIAVDTVFVCGLIEGNIPFETRFDPAASSFIRSANARPVSWQSFEQRRYIYQSLMPQIGQIKIADIRFDRYDIPSGEINIYIRDGFFQSPHFMVNILDGNLAGSFLLDPGALTAESMSYEIRAQASRINSASLVQMRRGKREKTELSASMVFTGKGLDPDKDMDINGFFHITEMGPQFAATLLRGLDPQGKDSGMRMTRRFLEMGWRPQLFSMEAKHGYVYPSLALRQPWYSPLRLPQKLEYGRIPLAFFLRQR